MSAFEALLAGERIAVDRALNDILYALAALPSAGDQINKQEALALVRKKRGSLWYDEHGRWRG